MKAVLCFALCFFSLAAAFSQNIEEITLEYQDEIELWMAQNNIRGEAGIQRFDGFDLFRKPQISPKYPEHKVFGKGGSVIDCFAVGRFLTKKQLI